MLEELKVKYWKSWKPNGMVWQCGNPGNSTRKKLVLPWGQERQREKLMKPRAGSQDFPVGAGTLERCSPCQGSCLRLEQGRCILTSPVLPPSDLLCFPLAYPGLMLEPGSLGNILIFTKRSFLWDRSSGESVRVWVSQETDSEMETGIPGVLSGVPLRSAPMEGKGLRGGWGELWGSLSVKASPDSVNSSS